ncbi:class I SAM-dependent methyltransferase [uncultured Litoreibacter sp.]|uniref:class I SAM-dependent methyltransferase n=1 Tax=uncultured Litoreibacter sp. TaxID=1392394 RepID=UPI0026345445|nr:class I SAM-dependent methyltransferase [uncultured Litoreibacter sp.]
MDVPTQYENAAPTWNKKVSRLGYSKAYTEFLAQGALRSGPVLDVGTGTGTFASSWLEAGGSSDLSLLDQSTEMLKQARQHFALRGVSPKIINSKFDDFSTDTKFDAILAAHVLEHFENPAEAMRKFARTLAPQGRLYLVVSKPHWCNWVIWLRFRHRWFAPEVIQEMAQDAGLSEVAVHSFLSGPPSRTSFGYIFSKTQPKDA